MLDLKCRVTQWVTHPFFQFKKVIIIHLQTYTHVQSPTHTHEGTCAVTQWFVLGLDASAGCRKSRSRSTTWFILRNGQQGATQLQGSFYFSWLSQSCRFNYENVATYDCTRDYFFVDYIKKFNENNYIIFCYLANKHAPLTRLTVKKGYASRLNN